MPNLGSSSTQTLRICHRRAKKPPTLSVSSPRISRVQSSDDRSSPRQIPILGAKQARSSISIQPKWSDWTKFGDGPAGDDDLNSSEQIPIWGAKRARNSISIQTKWSDWTKFGDGPAGDDDLNSSEQIPVWGAKRARSSISIQPKWSDWTKFGDGPAGDDDLNSSEQIPIWGAKRARNSISIQTKWRDWTNLGDGPAGLIAERLLANDVADYICFRAVCRPWRLCCTDPRAHCILDRRFHPLDWIMLRETGDSPRCRFMNVSTGCSRYVDLPELCGHDVFGPTTEGLLVLLDRTTWVVRLLNPLTRQAADLPPATTLMTKSDLKQTSCRRDLLQVSGAGLADDCTFAVHFRWIKTLAVIKPGDVHWILVDRGRWFLPALSFAGRFYCATTEAVMVVETSADQPPRLVIAANLTRPFATIMMDTVHIVDNGGELILVDRQCNGNDNRKYKVYRVDLASRKMVPIRGLGGRAVFIGIERALSVSPFVFPSISADAIYLGFDGQTTGMMDNSPIHLLDGVAEPRQFEDNIDGMTLYEPLGLDNYLSWCVTGYRDTLRDNV